MSKCTVVNLKKEDYDIYIGRGSIWGNPFRMKNKSLTERNRVCDEFEVWFMLPAQQWLRNLLPNLRGKKLGCYCKPLRCHGDFLARLVNELEQEND